jgi:DNA gyrase subunit A
MNIPDNDALRWVRWTDGRQEIILATRDGMSIRFPETDVRPMGRNATGVRGIRLRRHDEVVACQIVDARRHALVVSQGGYGKRTPFEEYRQQARGGIGIITYKVTAKTGSVVGLEVVDDGDELMLLTEQGVLIRIPVAPIRETGRSAQGVKLIDLAEGDWVKAVSKVVRRDEELLPEKPFRLLEVPSPSPVPAQELTEEEWEEESQAGPDLHLVE